VAIFGLGADSTALVIAPHPDDETLGAGGTIHRLASCGVAVHVLAVACHSLPGSDAQIRLKEFHQACDQLGVTDRSIAWVDDDRSGDPGRFQPDLVTLIESGSDLSITRLRPDLLLIPAATGFHQDHRAVHRAAFAAARPGGTRKPAPRLVLGYAGPEDAWTSAAEPWRIHINTSDAWPAKHAALAAYGSQLRRQPHPRTIEAIHTIDSAAGTAVGVQLAESFVPYRMVA
jgi:LmbE family N-acetylglucosaminyl deacetylase